MLAVKARLFLKLGREHACEALQQRVLSLRQARQLQVTSHKS